MPRAAKLIPVKSVPLQQSATGSVQQPEEAIAILQVEAKPDQSAPPAIPEFIRKQCGLLDRNSAALRIDHGPGRYEGKQYGLAHHPGGFPLITSGATGHMFAITWEALIKLAIAGGIDESGPESTVQNPRDL